MEARLAALPKAGAKRQKAAWEKHRYTKQELLGTLDLVAFNPRQSLGISKTAAMQSSKSFKS
jgi:hypothetical protein